MSLAIQYLPLSTLADRFLKGNAKLHDIGKISDSIQRYGFRDPLALDATLNNGSGGIVEGNGRLEALIKLRTMGASVPRFLVEVDGGDWAVPVVVGADSQTESEGKAYSIDHNLVGMFGADFTALDMSSLFDEGAYLSMLEELAEAEDLPLSVDADDLALLLDQLEDITELDPDALDEVPPHEEADTLTKEGDVWILGRHRLMCGDSTSIEHMERLCEGQLVDLWLTDPPYNVALGFDETPEQAKKRNRRTDGLTVKNDKMDNDLFRQFLCDAYSAADAVMKPGAVFYIWHADSEGYNFRGAAQDCGWKVRQCLIWKKSAMVMGRQDYQWKHESCLYGWKEGAGHLWASDRKQTTILEFDKPSRNGEHPTMKPVELFQYQILNNTKGKDLVLDSFAGSGTTAIACETNGRNARLMELDPKYCDVIIKRWQNLTGQSATLEATGQTYSELEAEKLGA